MAEPAEWLTVGQVADHLHVTQETVRRWLRAGELPGIYLGSTKAGYRVSRADLDAFIQQRYGRPAREPQPGQHEATALVA